MTFDDDHVLLNLAGYKGQLRVWCKQVGMDWPPPEFLRVAGGPLSTPVYRRIRMSAISDEDRNGMTHVCRGAEYVHDHDEAAEPGPGSITVH